MELPDQRKGFWSKLLDFAANTTAGVTKPFAKGANILAQGYGDLYRGLSGNTDYVSPLEEYIKSGITEEEMNRINEKPYLETLKSGAGMASTLAPVASNGLRTANIVSKSLPNKWLQSIAQGTLEGGLRGFSDSKTGEEALSATKGALLGIGGELAGRYIGDRSFREMLKNPRVARMQDLVDDAFKVANIDKQSFKKLAQSTPVRGRAMDYVQDRIEAISNATPTQEGMDALNYIQENFADQLGNSINMPQDMYSKALNDSMSNYMGVADTVKKIPEVSILEAKIANGAPVGTEDFRNATLKLLESVGLEEYPQELTNAVSRLSGVKGGEQKIFEMIRDFITKSASGM